MAHPLAGKWTVRLLTSQGSNDDGKMDLTSMNNEGDLDEGEHDHGGGFKEKIKGKAKRVSIAPFENVFALRIETKDTTRASYNGLVVRESAGQMVIVGGFCFKHQGSFDELELDEQIRFLLAQNEGVWVITKP